MAITQVYPRHYTHYISMSNADLTDIDFDSPTNGKTVTIDDTDWALMGFGVQDISESPDAQTKETAYINMTTSSTSVESYSYSLSGTADLVMTQKALLSLLDVPYSSKTGSDAERNVLIIDGYAETEAGSGKYFARLMRASVAVSDITKEGVTAVSFDYELNAVKDIVIGYFDLTTKTFTVDNTLSIINANIEAEEEDVDG